MATPPQGYYYSPQGYYAPAPASQQTPPPNSPKSGKTWLALILTFLLSNQHTREAIGKATSSLIRQITTTISPATDCGCSSTDKASNADSAASIHTPSVANKKHLTVRTKRRFRNPKKKVVPTSVAPLHIYTESDVTLLKESIAHLKEQIVRMPHPQPLADIEAEAVADTLFNKAIYYPESDNYEAIYRLLKQSHDKYSCILR